MPNARAWFYSQSFHGRLEMDLVSAPPRKPKLPCTRPHCDDPFCDREHPELKDTDHHVLGDDLNIYDNGGEEL